MQIFGEAVEKNAQECGFGAFAGFEPCGDDGHERTEPIRMPKERRAEAANKARQRVRTKRFVTARGLECGEIGVKMGDGFDAAEIVFEGEMFVGSVRVFVGQTEADEHAGNFESVMHLRNEGYRATLTDEDRFSAEAFFQSGLRLQENRGLIGCHPRFSHA